MIRIVHTADIHFGMENYGKPDPKTGIHSRLADFHRALSNCVDFAIKEKVDLFLFAGDAYRTAHPSQTQQKLLVQLFMRLYRAGIPVVIIVGNHDQPISFGKAHTLDIFGELPLDGFHVAAKPTSLCIPTKNGPLQIVGIPWPTRSSISIANKHLTYSANEISAHVSQGVAQIIASMAAKLNPDIPAILAGHLTVSTGKFSGSEKRAIYGTDPLLMPSQLAIKPFDYVALGHLHRYQNVNPGGYPAVVYSGSIERIDFGERKEKKGFCLISIPEKNKASHKFIPVPTRPFVQLEVHLKEGLPQTEQVIKEVQMHSLKDVIVKIVYHVPPGKSDAVNLKQVQQACAGASHLAAIVPIRSHETRPRRIGLPKARANLSELLDTYFESKQESKTKKNRLIKKSLELAQQCSEL